MQRIAHEIHRPHRAEGGHDRQGLRRTKWQTFLRSSGKFQTELAVYPPQRLMISGMPIQPEAPITLPEPPARLCRDHGGQRRNHGSIPLRPLHHRPVVSGAAQPHCATGLLNRKIMFKHQMLREHSFTCTPMSQRENHYTHAISSVPTLQKMPICISQMIDSAR